MNTIDYEEACLEHLSNMSFYEEVEEDPNANYRKQFDDHIKELRDEDLISEVEQHNMLKGERTPNFYGLPKLHNTFDHFPDIRPICSGTDSPSCRISEFVDSFLKSAAIKTNSYIKDTTDFINKTRNIALPEDQEIRVCSLDVKSLYTNIDHEEGTEACRHYLNGRRN